MLKKTEYNDKIKYIEDKIPDFTNLAATTTLNAKINQVKNEIPSITNLATYSALNGKINEVKKAKYLALLTNLLLLPLLLLKINYLALIIQLKNWL